MSEDACYKSFKAYESYVEQELKAGKLKRRQARFFLKDAKKNYKNQNYNRELEKING